MTSDAAEMDVTGRVAIVSHMAAVVNPPNQVSIGQLVEVPIYGSQTDGGNLLPHMVENPLGSRVGVIISQYLQNCISLLASPHNK